MKIAPLMVVSLGLLLFSFRSVTHATPGIPPGTDCYDNLCHPTTIVRVCGDTECMLFSEPSCFFCQGNGKSNCLFSPPGFKCIGLEGDSTFQRGMTGEGCPCEFGHLWAESTTCTMLGEEQPFGRTECQTISP